MLGLKHTSTPNGAKEPKAPGSSRRNQSFVIMS